MATIREFYMGKVILITGATGFMGKVLLEKMLRTLPGVKRIYILIRSKKGLQPAERVKTMLHNKPFTFYKIEETQLAKVIPIEANLTEGGLGISSEDRETLINEVSVVLHLAASVRFDLPLKEAMMCNVFSTKHVLDLSKEMKDLKSVIHLSTTYCNIDVEYMEEKVYDIEGCDPIELMNMVESMDESHLAKMEKSLIKPHPNTYTFTKRLAEIIVRDMGKDLPISIVRPSIVLAAYQEPVPGWVDNLNGPTGIFTAAGKGVLRVILANVDTCPQVIPVDVAINAVITVSWIRSIETFDEPPVYNVTQGDMEEYRITWREIIDICINLALKHPFKRMLWYPRGITTTSRVIFEVMNILFHFIPAFIIDFLMILFLQQPFLVNVQKRLYNGLLLVSYFTMKDFTFINEKTKTMVEKVTPEEQEIFYITNVKYDIAKFIFCVYMGTRKYCLKNEEVSDDLIWKVQLYAYYLVDTAVKAFLIYFCVSLLLSPFGLSYLLTCTYWKELF